MRAQLDGDNTYTYGLLRERATQIGAVASMTCRPRGGGLGSSRSERRGPWQASFLYRGLALTSPRVLEALGATATGTQPIRSNPGRGFIPLYGTLRKGGREKSTATGSRPETRRAMRHSFRSAG